MEEEKGIKLIREKIEASWAWFLEYHNETTMIASKKTNRKWFRAWNPYFDIKKIKILKPRQRTETIESIVIKKKYTPTFKENDEDIELNNKILSLIKQKKNRDEICKIIKINHQKLGHRLSKLLQKEIINIKTKDIKIYAPYPSPIKKYRLNFKAFSDYAKIKGIEFEEPEIEFIKYLFTSNVFRKNLHNEYSSVSYIEAIPRYFLKHFYIPFLEDKNKINYSKDTIKFLLSGGENYKDIDETKIIKEIEDTANDESNWNPLENLNNINRKILSKVNIKMLKILSN